MGRNQEIKVRCAAADLGQVRARAEAGGCGPFAALSQVDTYFRVPHDRLKLRETVDGTGGRAAEVIGYARPEAAGSRWSDYRRVPIPAEQADELRDALDSACGIASVVRKQRAVGVWRSTRIHLDTVEGLGCFVELETAVEDGGDAEAATEFAAAVALLGLERFAPVAGSYGEMAESSRSSERKTPLH